MAMVNMNNLLNGKDSRWLQLEVCREFQRNKCSRPDTECKFAHPPANVEVQNGRVIACYDSIKGRCNREKPPCKYFHPPQHLKDQLLINGRNHLALKNALMQQMGLSPGQPLVPGQVQAVAANPYLTGMPQVGSTYSPYFAPGPIMPTIMGPDPTGVGSPLGVVPQAVVAQQKMPRSDRLEMDMKSVGSFYYENFAFPAGMVPYKRPAADKSGVPVYQPNATTYQQLMQLQQPFVPVSCEYSTSPPIPQQQQQVQVQQQQPQQQQQQPQPQQSPSPGLLVAAADLQQIPISSSSSSSSTTTSSSVVVGGAAHAHAQLLQQEIKENGGEAVVDAAALAKEVAQQNYAKAVKLAAVNQSLQLSGLNPLNYTGVALNKQLAAAAAAAPQASYPRYQTAAGTLPLQFNSAAAAAALNLGINPYLAQQTHHHHHHQHQQLLLRQQAAAAAAAAAQQQQQQQQSQQHNFQFNPYSLAAVMRPPQYAAAYSPAQLAQYPVTVSAAPVPASAQTNTNSSGAANNNNNNNVVLQPYKKLKTT